MDYGQIAYAKVTDLEAYVRGNAQKKENRSVAAKSRYPHAAIDGGYSPVTVYGSGCVGVTATLTLRAPQGATDVRVWLYSGNKAVCYTDVRLAEGASAQYTLSGVIYPDDGEKITVKSQTDKLILEAVTVYADGNGVSVTDGGDGYKCDESGGSAYLVTEDNGGYITLVKVGTDISADVSHGSTYDIVALDGVIHVLVCDDNGNMWGVSYDGDLNELDRRLLGEGFEHVAAAQAVGGIQLAAVRDRKIYFAECGKMFLGLTDWVPADFESDADDVYLSKQTPNPVLFFRREGALYAKLPCEQSKSYDCISARMSFYYGS